MKKSFLLLMVLMFLLPVSVSAQEKLSVAVAANFISAFKEIAADFESKTGVKIEATFASTGNLYSQIQNGAPYDVFLSADEQRPDLLQKQGATDGIFIYARGQAILWSADKNFCKAASWQDALTNEKIRKLSIANTATAPYGTAAMTALKKTGQWEALQGKLVIAQSVAQSFQYAATQSVDAGFCALSAAAGAEGKKGCYYAIPEAPEVVQAGCILKSTKNKICAELFLSYMMSDPAAQIKKRYGYR
ncbi:MAG: molybdate ABC transporter substrate-binding protein [Smithellaceae bacterium]|nr:molybdate ABC transporter substrate-binding protein [Smithellaceae bacterium]NLX53433.1 molybdate ABC transporter substrate-binding protein [Deltaproteobacteria bacterium]